MERFVGASLRRAGILIETGWQSSLAATSLVDAAAQAVACASEDDSLPVVLVQRVLSCGRAEFSLAPADARSGSTETAGSLAEILSTIIDGARSHVINAINVGKGDDHVKLPTLDELRKAHRAAKHGLHKLGQHMNFALMRRHRRLKEFRNNPDAKHRRRKVRRAAPVGRVKPAGGAGATPKPSTTKRGATKTAERDVTVSGKVNGKPATTVVKRGSTYSLEKVNGGTALRRKGGRANFMVDSKSLGLL